MNRGETVYAEEPHPFHFDDPIPYVSVPQGKRGRLAAVPLVHEALAAARAYIAADAFGTWSTPSANKLIRMAAQRANRGTLHRVPDTPLLRDLAPARRSRPGGHPGPVRTHRRDHNADLRGADARQAARCDPAVAYRDRPLNPTSSPVVCRWPHSENLGGIKVRDLPGPRDPVTTCRKRHSHRLSSQSLPALGRHEVHDQVS